MKLACPGCGCHGSLDFFAADAKAREFGALLTTLPAGLNPDLARRYVALFRPHKRGLVWDRARDLLDELATMARAGGVTIHGTFYPASPALFNGAMQQMLDKPAGLVLPLKTHGYLARVVAGGSGPEAAAAEGAAEQQRRHDSQRRQPSEETAHERMERMRREAESKMTPEELAAGRAFAERIRLGLPTDIKSILK